MLDAEEGRQTAGGHARAAWIVAAGVGAAIYFGAVLLLPRVLDALQRLKETLPLALVMRLKETLPLMLLLVVAGGLLVVALLQLQRRSNPPALPALAVGGGPPPPGSTAALPDERPQAWSLEVLERIDWKRFEDLCCALYREKGIHVETVPLGSDRGIALRLFLDHSKPERASALVLCKAWNKLVGVRELLAFVVLMTAESVDKAFCMAPLGYTADARVLAAEHRIVLLDGRLMLAMIERLAEAPRRRLLRYATAGDWTTPTCPLCGNKLVARLGEGGSYWGCARAPKCYGSLPMRADAQ